MKKKTLINLIIEKLDHMIKWCNEMGKTLFWAGIMIFFIFIVLTILGG